MDGPTDTPREGAGKASWKERLRSPTRMAVAVLGMVFVLGLMGVHMPLLNRWAEAQRKLKKVEKREALIQEVGKLREQAALYRSRVPKGVNLTEWTEYLLNGARGAQVKVLRMEPKEVGRIGPCQAPEWRIEVEGDFARLGRFVKWLEGGDRVVRVDQLMIEADEHQMKMAVQIKGLSL